jgi:hypothetical protein
MIEYNDLINKKNTAVILIAILILNIVLFAFSVYNATIFWIVIIIVFLIKVVFFKKERE